MADKKLSERYSEHLTEREMHITIGKNDFGEVFPQGNVIGIEKISQCLKKAGGKPKKCELNDFSSGGKGSAEPEYIITMKKSPTTIIVIECKANVQKHETDKHNCPEGYAVDGALYYAKFLSKEYNVIALGVSGTSVENYKVSTYYWGKDKEIPEELVRGKNSLYEPEQYLNMLKGQRVIKELSLNQIRYTALNMHEKLREIKVSERNKPIMIAGILIALNNEEFCNDYRNITSFSTLLKVVTETIIEELRAYGVQQSKIDYIINAFKVFSENTKFKSIEFNKDGSLLWYIEELENKIKPMMDNADSTIDALGVFYHEFIKYSGGDGKGLGIVLTPQHLTEFMCELANVNKNSKVVDICCGSGSFLVTAMSKMFEKANKQEIDEIRKNRLYGIEFDTELYVLALANMIIRKDGKSNLYHGDCFDKNIINKLKKENINVGLINPPYSQKDKEELEFVENLLDILTVGGTGVVVVPMSCAIGTKFKETRKRLFEKHCLKAVFSMPEDIFYPTGTNVCVMVWEAHVPHDSTQETFFGYYKEDGFIKKKKVGRVDVNNRWKDIKKEWITLYRNKDVVDGLTARKCITDSDEWLCEAYMKTDYSQLAQNVFQQSVNDYYAHIIKSNNNSEKLINTDDWKEFSFERLFGKKVSRGTRLTKIDRVKGEIPLVTAGFLNEGISSNINNPEMERYCNCLTIDMFGNCFYRGYVFNADDNILILKNEEFSKYTYLFLASVINTSKYKYAYGRQYRQKDYRRDYIKLPILYMKEKTQNSYLLDTGGDKIPYIDKRKKYSSYGYVPDFEYMDNYIKSLSYSDMI